MREAAPKAQRNEGDRLAARMRKINRTIENFLLPLAHLLHPSDHLPKREGCILGGQAG
jgi:hypothetical protein